MLGARCVVAARADRRDVVRRKCVLAMAMRSVSVGRYDCAASRGLSPRQRSLRAPVHARAQIGRGHRAGPAGWGGHPLARRRKVCGDQAGLCHRGLAAVPASWSDRGPSVAAVDRGSPPSRARRVPDPGRPSCEAPVDDLAARLGSAARQADGDLDVPSRGGLRQAADDLSTLDSEAPAANRRAACRAMRHPHRDSVANDSAALGVANLAVASSDHHWVREDMGRNRPGH